jgi:inosose dehydratase
MGLCIDVAHVAAGGGDPASVIRRYADRLVYVHLKDLDRATTTFRPLGEGDLDLDAIIDAVIDAGYDDWITVELDGFRGDQDLAAARSLRYLQRGKLS